MKFFLYLLIFSILICNVTQAKEIPLTKMKTLFEEKTYTFKRLNEESQSVIGNNKAGSITLTPDDKGNIKLMMFAIDFNYEPLLVQLAGIEGANSFMQLTEKMAEKDQIFYWATNCLQQKNLGEDVVIGNFKFYCKTVGNVEIFIAGRKDLK